VSIGKTNEDLFAGFAELMFTFGLEGGYSAIMVVATLP
jgi:hypothetical protein